MKMKVMNWMKGVMLGCAVFGFSACNDESDLPKGKGEVEIEITDAPSDDANIKSVMVTIAEIKVDGKTVSGFTKQTIDLKAYQEGATKLLATTELAAKSYNNLTLVLDLEQDADGNSPGCYVLTQDNAKFKLKTTASGKTDVLVNQTWNVAQNTKSKVVLDFDLRKAIRYSDDASRYSFVSDANLNSAIRVIARERSGLIKGSYNEQSSVDGDKIIIYAYKKGSFNASAETQPQGSDQIMFKNAVTSAEVKQTITGKSYTLCIS
jgi:hypothetical protein